jgi:transcription elongation factor Elf1
MLPPEKIAIALQRIAAWRAAPDQPASCPVCDALALSIIDQSARPYAEWYDLNCSACGLAHVLHVPLAPPV